MNYKRYIKGRRLEVLKLTSLGYSRKEVAAMLHYGEVTIKRDRKTLVELLGARNIPHAIRLAFEKGLLKRKWESRGR